MKGLPVGEMACGFFWTGFLFWNRTHVSGLFVGVQFVSVARGSGS